MNEFDQISYVDPTEVFLEEDPRLDDIEILTDDYIYENDFDDSY